MSDREKCPHNLCCLSTMQNEIDKLNSQLAGYQDIERAKNAYASLAFDREKEVARLTGIIGRLHAELSRYLEIVIVKPTA